MENLIHTMMDLIASEVGGKAVDVAQYAALTDEELVRLYKLSKSHDLAHLVGDALIKNNLVKNEEIKAKFQKQALLAVYRYEKINYELERLRGALNEAHVPFLPLKGSVMRQYYPEPWMRTSCDIDILVHERDLERAVATLVGQLSYRKDGKGSHDVGLFSDSGVHLELHYSLIEGKLISRVESVLQSVWDAASPVADTSEHALNDEMFYYYHIAHMAKHFVNGGCGIRPFLDLWVLSHCLPCNREKREALLREGGLLTFALRAEELSRAWFDDGEQTDVTRRMQDYLLRGGVYGTIENCVSVQQIRRGGKWRYALSRIWISYDVLKFQYPSLEGKRWLLPVYEVRRWFRLLFCGGAKRSVNELKLNSTTTRAEQAEARELLDALELNQ